MIDLPWMLYYDQALSDYNLGITALSLSSM